jgi:hypothetical protein
MDDFEKSAPDRTPIVLPGALLDSFLGLLILRLLKEGYGKNE